MTLFLRELLFVSTIVHRRGCVEMVRFLILSVVLAAHLAVCWAGDGVEGDLLLDCGILTAHLEGQGSCYGHTVPGWPWETSPSLSEPRHEFRGAPVTAHRFSSVLTDAGPSSSIHVDLVCDFTCSAKEATV